MKRIIPFTFIAVTLLFVFPATVVAKDARSIHHFRMVQQSQNMINFNFEKPVVQVVMFDAKPKFLSIYHSQKLTLDLNVGHGFSAALTLDVMAVEYPFIISCDRSFFKHNNIKQVVKNNHLRSICTT